MCGASGRGAAAGERRDGAEGARVTHREIREDLAVERDVRLLQAGDEARVRQAERTGRGVDARDPEAAEVPLLQAAADVAVLPGVADDLDRLAEAVLAVAEEAFGLLDDAVVTAAGLEATFCAGHVRSS